MQMAQQAAQDGLDEQDEASACLEAFPASLLRRYEVRLVPPATGPGAVKPLPLREVRASMIGHLVRVRGIVTRVTDVKPLVEVHG